MKLFFLGTGAAEGVPALFCNCNICIAAKQRGGRDIRTRTTILVDDTIKIDLPPETLTHVHRYPQINLAELQHLLFTHSHDDHFAVRELQYLSPNFAPTRKEPLDIWATGDVLNKMSREMEHFFEQAPLRCHVLTPFKEHKVGHLAVTTIVAHHKEDELCLNFLLHDRRDSGSNDRGKTLLYATDTGWYDTPTWDFLQNCRLDGVILECGKGNSDSAYEGHLNIEEVLQVRERLMHAGALPEAAPFLLTHIAHTGLLLHEEMERLVSPHGIQVAYDGLELTL